MKTVGTGKTGPDSVRAMEAGMIGAIAQWCECLHGSDPLLMSLEFIGNGLGAQAVALARHGRLGQEGRVLSWDGGGADVRGGPVERSYARAVIGEYFDKARPGTLWFRSMIDDTQAPELAALHRRRHLHELVVIPLETSERGIDLLELHFEDPLRNYQHALLNILAPVLTRTWKNRARGLFTEALLRVGPRPQEVPAAPILSIDNPARLSRAEYRVCLFLSRGLTMDELKAELGICESTLRTHLSNLYAKTGTANAAELIYQLVSVAPFSPEQSRHRVA